MCDTETQTSEYYTAPSTQNPRESSPEAKDDVAEKENSNDFDEISDKEIQNPREPTKEASDDLTENSGDFDEMSDTETQTTQNPNPADVEKEKSNNFGLFDNLPNNVTLTKFLPAAVETNMLNFITGKDSLEQSQ